MKLKNIFATLLAGLVIFNSCDQEESMFLSEVRVSSSYIGLPAAGGSKTITLTASGDWAIDIPETVASWLTVNPVSGKAGTVEVTFTAAETATTNSAALCYLLRQEPDHQRSPADQKG